MWELQFTSLGRGSSRLRHFKDKCASLNFLGHPNPVCLGIIPLGVVSSVGLTTAFAPDDSASEAH